MCRTVFLGNAGGFLYGYVICQVHTKCATSVSSSTSPLGRMASSVWFPRRNGQHRRRRYPLGRDQVLRRITPRIELEADLCALVDRLFAVGVIVEAEAELSASLEEFGCAIGEDVTIVAPRVFSEQ